MAYCHLLNGVLDILQWAIKVVMPKKMSTNYISLQRISKLKTVILKKRWKIG